jgi:hypothetical protein
MAFFNRYKELFDIKEPTDPQPGYKIKDRNTDLYVAYNQGDRLDIISKRVYGTSEYWWVILAANNYTIEFDIEYGEVIRIPLPLSDVLNGIRDQV